VALAARALSRVIPDSINPKSRVRQARRFLAVASRPMAERYPRWLTYFQDEMKPRLYSPEFAGRLNGQKDGQKDDWMKSLFGGLQKPDSSLHPVDAAMAVDVMSYLPFDLLVKVDITSMANSLEARSPFLDHEVMEFAARLPVSIKFRGGRLKRLLKRAFADLLPLENVNRRKMGFGVPVGQWFHGPLRELLQDALLSPQSLKSGYFREEEVRRLVDQHLDRRADHSFQLWNLLMLEMWRREFLGGR
jgi:asparagine synthase (glutamine-hydrolysing)